MFYLHMDAREFGIKSSPTVKAPYNTLEEAQAQATHNLTLGLQRPVRIEDENGNVVEEFK